MYESFQYLGNKIKEATFLENPFKHIYIENFLNDEDFNLIINNNQINLKQAKSTLDLVNNLNNEEWKIIKFPGCTTDINQYIKEERSPKKRKLVEGSGVTFKLNNIRDKKISDLVNYLNSSEFKNILISKFDIKKDARISTGIQKNLSGYEISPHPDIRSKCLTYLVNINTQSQSESDEMNTHLLEFIDSKKYIYDFWKYNNEIERCWVPWEWCKTIKNISSNNSLIMFQPHHRSLHAIKLVYDHLKFQRTQLYGNMWYNSTGGPLPRSSYEQLRINIDPKPRFISRLKNKIFNKIRI